MTSIPSWVAALGIIAPPITGLLGYVLAGRNEEARDKRTEAREEARDKRADAREERARRDALAERLAERRHNFQLDLLLDLQERMLALVRSTARVLTHDRQTLKEQGTLTLLPSGLDEVVYDAGVAFSRAIVRVLNDGLRAQLEEFHKLATGTETLSMTLRKTPPDQAIKQIDAALLELTQHYQAVNERLGRTLRDELGIDPASFGHAVSAQSAAERGPVAEKVGPK